MKRSAYMTLVMESTYPQVAINAVLAGTLEGAWEKAIAEQLKKDWLAESPLPIALIKEINLWEDFDFSNEDWLKAAYIIRATKPQTENV